MDFNMNGKAELIVGNMLYEYNSATGNMEEAGTVTGLLSLNSDRWGDFNGDGLIDFLASDGRVFLQNVPDGNTYSFSNTNTISGTILAVADLNNDGISDFVMRNNNFEQEYTYVIDPEGDYAWDYFTEAYVYCPPFNNDCFTNPGNPLQPIDIVRYREVTTAKGYRIYLADHSGATIAELGYFNVGSFVPSHAIVADIDADGTPDLLICRTTAQNVFVEQIMYQFRTSSEGGFTWQTKNRSIHVDAAMQGDFTGDGIVELLTEGRLWKFASGNPGHLLASVTNGNNQKTLFEYASLTSGIYTKGLGDWPQQTLQVRCKR